MGLKIRVTRKTLKDHFRYYAWAYIVVLLVTGTIFNTVVTTIKNQSAPEEKLFACFCGDFVPGVRLEALTHEMEKAFPEMKVVTTENLPYNMVSTMSSTYKQKFLSYISNHFGDLMVLPYTEFSDLAKYGTFEPLDNVLPEYIKKLDAIDLKTVTMNNEDGEAFVYGIPLINYELFPYSYDTGDKVLVITAYSQNKENAIKLAEWLLKYMKETDWYEGIIEK